MDLGLTYDFCFYILGGISYGSSCGFNPQSRASGSHGLYASLSSSIIIS